MGAQKMQNANSLRDWPKYFGVAVFILALLMLSACTVNVKKTGEGDENKQVDIKVPFAGIHVDKQANVADIDLPVYPGARQKEKDGSGEEKNANVNISAGKYGVRVVAIEYVSDDAPDKVLAYYRDQMKKFGIPLECHTSHSGNGATVDFGKDDSDALSCDNDSGGKVVELKVGTKENQRIVSIKPAETGKGTDFGLVRVQIRGKDAA
ncbi:MAG TPA: hypothetical protein VLW84_03945 [Terriglobales bacterium]|nr:hypothetical protein [Terriglobales bacterium]